MESVGSLFRDNLNFSLGSGSRVRFWVDLWVESRCWLMDRFPSLFELSLQKKELVGRVWDVGCEPWVFKWIRELNVNDFLDYMDL